MSARVAVVVQARVGSTRLPGKVLLPLSGRPLLQRMTERLRAMATPVELVVATTWHAIDDPIEEICARIGVRSVRGHPTDLVARHVQAATETGADVVVKIPSDCPLIDPAVADRVLARFLGRQGAIQYMSNLHPATWPDGNDVEVMTVDTLRIVDREARDRYEREHTTPYLWDRQERFPAENVVDEHSRQRAATHRLTLDYVEDYHVIRAVHDALWSPDRPFGVEEIVSYLDAHPHVRDLNARHRGVSRLRHRLDALRTGGGSAGPMLTTRSYGDAE